VPAVPLFQPAEATAPAPRRRRATSKPAAEHAPVDDEAAEPTAAPTKATATKATKTTKTTKATKPEPAAAEPTGGSDPGDSAATPDTPDADGDAGADGDDQTGQRKRRRRGGRGRRKPAGEQPDSATADEQDAESGASADSDRSAGQAGGTESGEAAGDGSGEAAGGDSGIGDAGTGDGDGTSASSRRRRRRRRKSGSGEAAEPRNDDPEETVVRVRETRKSDNQITATKGSTRVEAKRQRRRDGRDSGRRRPAIMSESEFLSRRESVERVMVVRQKGTGDDSLTQLAVLEDGMLVEHYVDQGTQRSIIGNIYLGKVQNVLPAMEAAFIDIGRGRNAVLYAGEVDWSKSEGKPKRIEEALTSGQSVLVQVTKDPIGHKGSRLTSSISLPGRFVVYVPGGSMSGISRKLSDSERSRLRTILKDVVPDEAEVIIRTAAEGAGEDELRRDVARLKAQWEDIERKVKSGSAPAALYAEPDLTVKIVRDLFNEDFAKLVVAGDDAWDTIEPYVTHVAPALTDRLERWESDDDVFEHYRVDEQIAKALDRKVWLPSGGSLVIDRTEAMTVVDVNTGKFTGRGGNLEETVTKNNLEAAEEVARQLRLRDIGGIIVVDFIDMVLESNRDLLMRRLVECLARDRTRHQVAEVTSLGLVQMTRKRIGTGLLETFSTPCDCCGGRGLTTTSEPVPVPKQQEREPRRGKAAPKAGKAATTRKKSSSTTRSTAKAEPATPEASTDGDATV
jgi:ribonuclease E